MASINRPLNNTMWAEEENQDGLVEVQSSYTDQQLKLGIKQKPNFLESAGFLRFLLEKRVKMMEFSTLWKNPALPFALITLIFNTMVIVIGGIVNFEKIPIKVPFIYNSIDRRWEQSDKLVVIVALGLIISMEISLAYLVMTIFRHDRRLGIVISVSMTLINILMLVAILQIYSLIA